MTSGANPCGLRAALATVLSSNGRRPAPPAQVEGFAQYIERAQLGWRAWPAPGAPVGVTLELPGGALLLLLAKPTGADRARFRLQLTAIRLEAVSRGVPFIQALLEPQQVERAELLAGAGFQRMTALHYLERDRAYPWVDPPGPAEGTWVGFTPALELRFTRCLSETYKNSLDCPELARLRTPASALAGHRATGEYDPALWELLVIDGVDAGCLLLSPWSDADTLEIVYMGVSHVVRRKGLGALLLRRALQRCRERGVQRLTLAVDARNGPALRLYERMGFREITRRDAWLAPLGAPLAGE